MNNNCYYAFELCADDIQFSYGDEDDSWRERETKHFETLRDKNGDGVLNKEEVEQWLYPPNTDPCVNEAKHLIHHADVDKVKYWFCE